MNGNGTSSHGATAGEAPRFDPELIDHTPAEIPLQDQVRRAMLEHGLSQKDAAAQIGANPGTFNQWLQDKYPGDNAKIAHKVQGWLRSLGERTSMASLLPDAPPFFESETAKKIISHLKYAHTLGDMLTVFGVPGVGKSSALRHYQRAYPNVWIATMTPATTGVVPVLQEICDAMGAGKANGARRLTQAILARAKNTNGLLIIDEAHHMGTLALDALRGLHDAVGLAIAFVGDVTLEAKLQSMPQFYSRVGLKLFVTRVLAGDIAAQLDAWGLNKRETRTFLTQLAQKPGALRGVTKVLRLATVLASSEGKPLDTTHIKAAAETLAPQATGDE